MTTGLCTDSYRSVSLRSCFRSSHSRLAGAFFKAHTHHLLHDLSPHERQTWEALRETASKLADRAAPELSYNENALLKRALARCPECDDVQFLNSMTFTIGS